MDFRNTPRFIYTGDKFSGHTRRLHAWKAFNTIDKDINLNRDSFGPVKKVLSDGTVYKFSKIYGRPRIEIHVPESPVNEKKKPSNAIAPEMNAAVHIPYCVFRGNIKYTGAYSFDWVTGMEDKRNADTYTFGIPILNSENCSFFNDLESDFQQNFRTFRHTYILDNDTLPNGVDNVLSSLLITTEDNSVISGGFIVKEPVFSTPASSLYTRFSTYLYEVNTDSVLGNALVPRNRSWTIVAHIKMNATYIVEQCRNIKDAVILEHTGSTKTITASKDTDEPLDRTSRWLWNLPDTLTNRPDTIEYTDGTVALQTEFQLGGTAPIIGFLSLSAMGGDDRYMPRGRAVGFCGQTDDVVEYDLYYAPPGAINQVYHPVTGEIIVTSAKDEIGQDIPTECGCIYEDPYQAGWPSTWAYQHEDPDNIYIEDSLFKRCLVDTTVPEEYPDDYDGFCVTTNPSGEYLVGSDYKPCTQALGSYYDGGGYTDKVYCYPEMFQGEQANCAGIGLFIAEGDKLLAMRRRTHNRDNVTYSQKPVLPMSLCEDEMKVVVAKYDHETGNMHLAVYPCESEVNVLSAGNNSKRIRVPDAEITTNIGNEEFERDSYTFAPTSPGYLLTTLGSCLYTTWSDSVVSELLFARVGYNDIIFGPYRIYYDKLTDHEVDLVVGEFTDNYLIVDEHEIDYLSLLGYSVGTTR